MAGSWLQWIPFVKQLLNGLNVTAVGREYAALL